MDNIKILGIDWMVGRKMEQEINKLIKRHFNYVLNNKMNLRMAAKRNSQDSVKLIKIKFFLQPLHMINVLYKFLALKTQIWGLFTLVIFAQNTYILTGKEWSNFF